MKIYRHKEDGRLVVPDFVDFRIDQKSTFVYTKYGGLGVPPVITITYKHWYDGKLGSFKFRCSKGVFRQQYTEVPKHELTPLYRALNGDK